MKLIQLFPMSCPGWCSVFGRCGVVPAEAGTPNLPRKRSEFGQRLGLRRQSGSVDGGFERMRSVEVSNRRRADQSGVALRLPPQSKIMPRFGSTSTRSASICRRILSWPAALLVVGALLAGCGRKEDHHHQDHDHDHDHDHKPPSGASFKAGEGITLAAETRRILGLETAEVSRRKLPRQIRFTVQVFGEKHHHALNQSDHSGCDVHGSGLVSTNTAAVVKAGQPVQIQKGTNHPLGGVVLGVQKALALGESEIIIGVSNALTLLQPGEFIPARITLPRDEPVVTIPRAALLRTAEGTFVYAANGNAFLRRTVTAGTEVDGWLEIMDGLEPGEQVVTQPVQTLWLIELRETKGGGHSH